MPKLCKISSNFNLILRKDVTVGANHKFFTFTWNFMKAIAANQGVE